MADADITTNVHCEIEKTATGIHIYRVLRATRRAVEEGAAYYRHQRNHHYTVDDPMLFLFDLRPDGFPPLTHTYHLFKNLFQDYPMPKGSRAAYLLAENHPMVSVATSFFELLRLGTRRRFFYGEDSEHRALAFLLQED